MAEYIDALSVALVVLGALFFLARRYLFAEPTRVSCGQGGCCCKSKQETLRQRKKN